MKIGWSLLVPAKSVLYLDHYVYILGGLMWHMTGYKDVES